MPIVHSYHLDATVNPHGNRTDYEFHVLEGRGHSLVSRDRMQNDTAWFDRHLRNVTMDPGDVALFDGAFSFKNEATRFISLAALFVVAGFFPLVFLLESILVASWARIRGRKDVILGRYMHEIRTAWVDPPVPPSVAVPVKDRAIIAGVVVSTWLLSCLVSGVVLVGLPLSRVLTFFGIPAVLALVSCLVIDGLLKRQGKTRARVFAGLNDATRVPGGDVLADLVLAACTVIPAWLVQLIIVNLASRGSLVAVEVVNLFLHLYPRNPLSPGILLILGTFVVASLVLSSVFRGTFTLLSGDKFDNTARTFKNPVPRAREPRRFLRWLYMMLLHALLVGGLVTAGCVLFLAFMPGGPVPDVDIELGFNEAMALVAGVVGFVTVLVQQVVEKVFRSHGKGVLVAALLLLGFFLAITPRPV